MPTKERPNIPKKVSLDDFSEDDIIHTATDEIPVETDASVITSHSQLRDLNKDDHPQYLTSERAAVEFSGRGHSHIARDIEELGAQIKLGLAQILAVDSGLNLSVRDGSIVISVDLEHGALKDMGNNDHPQYVLKEHLDSKIDEWVSANVVIPQVLPVNLDAYAKEADVGLFYKEINELLDSCLVDMKALVATAASPAFVSDLISRHEISSDPHGISKLIESGVEKSVAKLLAGFDLEGRFAEVIRKLDSFRDELATHIQSNEVHSLPSAKEVVTVKTKLKGQIEGPVGDLRVRDSSIQGSQINPNAKIPLTALELNLRDRANHDGTQPVTSIEGLTELIDARIAAALAPQTKGK